MINPDPNPGSGLITFRTTDSDTVNISLSFLINQISIFLLNHLYQAIKINGEKEIHQEVVNGGILQSSWFFISPSVIKTNLSLIQIAVVRW